MYDGKAEAFEGVTIVRWNEEGKIENLKEFGCNINRYDPYENSGDPVFRDEKTMWF